MELPGAARGPPRRARMPPAYRQTADMPPPFAARAPPLCRRSPPAHRQVAADRRPRTAEPPPFAARAPPLPAAIATPPAYTAEGLLPKKESAQCRHYVRRRWRGVMTRGDGRSRHFGTAVAVQAVQCRALSAVPRRRAPPLGTKSPHLMLHSCWCRWGQVIFVNEKIVNEF